MGKYTDMATEGAFLIERLLEFERALMDEPVEPLCCREWAGHVAPSLARFRDIIGKAWRGTDTAQKSP